MTARATSSEHLVFGDGFQRTIEWICVEAYQADTPDAWEAAARQLQGLDRLVLTMPDGMPDTFLLHLLVRLQAVIATVDAAARDARQREEPATDAGSHAPRSGVGGTLAPEDATSSPSSGPAAVPSSGAPTTRSDGDRAQERGDG